MGYADAKYFVSYSILMKFDIDVQDYTKFLKIYGTKARIYNRFINIFNANLCVYTIFVIISCENAYDILQL